MVVYAPSGDRAGRRTSLRSPRRPTSISPYGWSRCCGAASRRPCGWSQGGIRPFGWSRSCGAAFANVSENSPSFESKLCFSIFWKFLSTSAPVGHPEGTSKRDFSVKKRLLTNYDIICTRFRKFCIVWEQNIFFDFPAFGQFSPSPRWVKNIVFSRKNSEGGKE